MQSIRPPRQEPHFISPWVGNPPQPAVNGECDQPSHLRLSIHSITNGTNRDTSRWMSFTARQPPPADRECTPSPGSSDRKDLSPASRRYADLPIRPKTRSRTSSSPAGTSHRSGCSAPRLQVPSLSANSACPTPSSPPQLGDWCGRHALSTQEVSPLRPPAHPGDIRGMISHYLSGTQTVCPAQGA